MWNTYSNLILNLYNVHIWYVQLLGSTKRLHKESHQIMNSISMLQPISKCAQTIISPQNITEVVRKAFKVAEIVADVPVGIEKLEIVGFVVSTVNDGIINDSDFPT